MITPSVFFHTRRRKKCVELWGPQHGSLSLFPLHTQGRGTATTLPGGWERQGFQPHGDYVVNCFLYHTPCPMVHWLPAFHSQ